MTRPAVERRRIDRARQGRQETRRTAAVHRGDVDAVVLGPEAPDEVEELPPAGKDLRPVVRVFASARIEFRDDFHFAAAEREARDRSAPAWCEENHVVLA